MCGIRVPVSLDKGDLRSVVCEELRICSIDITEIFDFPLTPAYPQPVSVPELLLYCLRETKNRHIWSSMYSFTVKKKKSVLNAYIIKVLL